MPPLDSCGLGLLHTDGDCRRPSRSHLQLPEQETCKVPHAERASQAKAGQVFVLFCVCAGISHLCLVSQSKSINLEDLVRGIGGNPRPVIFEITKKKPP